MLPMLFGMHFHHALEDTQSLAYVPMLAEMGIMLIYYASIMLYYAKNFAILC